jgi:ribosome biogenesis protein MAK21
MKDSMPRAEEDDGDGHTEHSIPDSESDERASSDTEGDREGLSESEHDSNLDGGFDDIGFLSAEDSDTGDQVHLVTETPVDIIQRGQTGSAAQESPVFGGGKKRKRKGPGKEDMQIHKKKLRNLPTFASYEDFAEMIEDDPEENL